ncbi:EF-hand domain-containing protein [Herminiimonas aquatilis]|uniref:EF-hand domain-containing protein n=1 Tax=Herminiimonas aquatilis TaxID=345342 RepID=A0ABW2J3L7_9BURK
MAIGGIGNSSGTNAWAVQRPDATKIANDLFAKVDTTNQGYIDKAGLQSALGNKAADSASDVDQLFSQIDSDQDGKITKQELTDGVKQLADALDAQFDSSRIARAGGQTPPAPPSADDIFASLDTKNQGYLGKEELQAAFDANSTDSAANAEKVDQIFKTLDADGDNKITKAELSVGLEQMGGPEQAADSSAGAVDASAAPASAPAGGARPSGSGSGDSADSDSTEYEAADANKDGTVSLQELVAYQATHPTATSTESDAQTSMKAVMKIVAQLTQAYGQFDQSVASTASSLNTISETA